MRGGLVDGVPSSLPRRTAEVEGPSGPEAAVACGGNPPRDVSSSADERVVCRLWPISRVRSGAQPEACGLTSRLEPRSKGRSPPQTSVCRGRSHAARDLGAVALVLRTSVRGAGSSATGRLRSGTVGSFAAVMATSQLHPVLFCCSSPPLFHVDSLRSRLTVDAGSSVVVVHAPGFASR